MYRDGTPRGEISKQEGVPLPTIWYWTKDVVSEPLSFIQCAACGKQKRTLNSQRKYCSEGCKNRANYLRRKKCLSETEPEPPLTSDPYRMQADAVLQVDPSRISEEQLDRCLEILEQAEPDPNNMSAYTERYRKELDTVEQYYAENKGSVSPTEYNRIQDIFKKFSSYNRS